MTKQQLKQFKSVGRNAKVSDRVVVYGAENVSIGDNTRIDAGVSILAASKGSYLNLGSHIHVAVGAIFMASGGIDVGDFSTVGFNSSLVSASDAFDGSCLVGPVFEPEFINVTKAAIVLQPHSIITTHCVLLPGSMMLEGSVLGAMAMLKGVAKPWTIYAGVPAKPVKTRSMRALALGEEWRTRFEEIMKSGSV